MTPDFTLIWPLSCLKDGVHLSLRSPAVKVRRVGPRHCLLQEVISELRALAQQAVE